MRANCHPGWSIQSVVRFRLVWRTLSFGCHDYGTKPGNKVCLKMCTVILCFLVRQLWKCVISVWIAKETSSREYLVVVFWVPKGVIFFYCKLLFEWDCFLFVITYICSSALLNIKEFVIQGWATEIPVLLSVWMDDCQN